MDDFEAACIYADRIEAREQLNLVAASAYPHAKKSWADSYHKSLYKQANPPSTSTTEGSVTTEDLALIMGSRGGRG